MYVLVSNSEILFYLENIVALSEECVVNKEVFIGDWCVISKRARENRDEGNSLDPKVYIGIVLGFSYLRGKKFKDREYSKYSAPVTSDVDKGIGMLCSRYTYNAAGVLTSVLGDKHMYISIESYIATIKRPAYTNKMLTISSKLCEKLNMIEIQPQDNHRDQQ